MKCAEDAVMNDVFAGFLFVAWGWTMAALRPKVLGLQQSLAPKNRRNNQKEPASGLDPLIHQGAKTSR